MKTIKSILLLSLFSTIALAQEVEESKEASSRDDRVAQSFALNNGYPTLGFKLGSFIMVPDEQSLYSSFGSKTGTGFNAFGSVDLSLPLPNKFIVDFGGDVLLANGVESSGIQTNSLTLAPRIKIGYRIPIVSNVDLQAKFGVGVAQSRVYSEDDSGNSILLQTGSASWGALSMPVFSGLQANFNNGLSANISFQQFFMADPMDGVVSSKYSGDWTILTGVGYNISIPKLGIPQEEIGKSNALARAEKRRELRKDSIEKAKFAEIEEGIQAMRDSLEEKNEMIAKLITAMDEFEAKTQSTALMPKTSEGAVDNSSGKTASDSSQEEPNRDDVSSFDREYFDENLDAGFYMVLGSFRNEKYAENFLGTLQDDYGLSAALAKVGDGNVRVVLGPFETWTEASKRLKELRTGGRRAWILELR